MQLGPSVPRGALGGVASGVWADGSDEGGLAAANPGGAEGTCQPQPVEGRRIRIAGVSILEEVSVGRQGSTLGANEKGEVPVIVKGWDGG